MAAKKFYAVKSGKKTGIFNSWEECKANVEGFPNAEYKSFSSKQQADDYLHGKTAASDIPDLTPGEAIAYIDGSYSHGLKQFSYAVILFINNEKIIFSGYDDFESNPELAKMRNVAGELKAAMHAIKLAKEHGAKRITLYYDYAGIEMWPTGKWKAKLLYTQEYAKYVQKMMSKLDVKFVKVAAHTGDRYNEEADQLAKAALSDETA